MSRRIRRAFALGLIVLPAVAAAGDSERRAEAAAARAERAAERSEAAAGRVDAAVSRLERLLQEWERRRNPTPPRPAPRRD